MQSSDYAYRHMDGVWRSADEVPRGKDGRILAHVALNGHGSYPTATFIPRNLLAFNDYTSNQGAVWDPVSSRSKRMLRPGFGYTMMSPAFYISDLTTAVIVYWHTR